jgi:hypothetical protein
MRTITWHRIAFTAGLSLLMTLGAGPAGAGEVTRLAVAPGSRLGLEGTTNVSARWACQGERIEGAMEVDAPSSVVVTLVDRVVDAAPGELAETGDALPNPRLRIEVPVSAFACGNRVMESDMRRALRATEHPSIIYQYDRVTRLTPLGARRFNIEVEGDLALAGSKRRVRTQVVGERLAEGLYRVTGEMNLRMTDFGIEPPTALMGVIKARNQLRVRFDLRLKLAGERRTESKGRPREIAQ